jgi:hypothetical protein
MTTNQKKSGPCFKTMFYKGVELFVHRDESKKPVQLRLYDALSGWVMAAGMTKAEARYQGIKNPIVGKNEEELLQILENKLTGHDLKGESFKDLITRRRGENPPREEQQAILKAYVEATAASRKAESKIGLELMRAPVTTKVAVTGDQQPRKEIIKMPEIQQRSRCNLILHCGAHSVSRSQVDKTPCPKATKSWQPIGHGALLASVESALYLTGLRVGAQAHSLTEDGARYFGLTEVQGPNEAEDYRMVIGIRNSCDKSLPVGLCLGSAVVVCDNLAFHGSWKVSRRHTTYLQRDLPQLVASGVGKLMELWGHQAERIARYKQTIIRDRTAHDLVVRAFDLRVVSNRMIPEVLHEYREPRHPEAFSERSMWSLYNAITETIKGNLPALPRRTEALTALFDTHCGLPAAHLN